MVSNSKIFKYLASLFVSNDLRVLVVCLDLLLCSTIVYGQLNPTDSITSLLNRQLALFPQEKIYLHTDKPYYISGERIWFRAHLVEAICHIPSPVSRYVFVELINPLDSVVTRVKIRQEEGVYHGVIPIPDDSPEGDYTMRAYTTYMRSQDEEYFYAKTVRIGDPQARSIHADTQFRYESGRQVYAKFRFTNVNDSEPLIPQSASISVNDGRKMILKVADDGTADFNFMLPSASHNNTILLEIWAGRNPYRQFISVPAPDNDFDVSFYPEGGSIMQGVSCIIAFKAMKSNGQATEVSGVVSDQSGAELVRFESEHLGMGCFSLVAEKGKTYYAVCENSKGQTKRFKLPVAAESGYSLAVYSVRERLYVSALRPASLTGEVLEIPQASDKLYLLAHTRGMVHYAGLWDNEKNLVFSKEQFPSGVLHLILFDAGLNPVSERLVFINNEDQAKASISPDKESYAPRSLVKNRVMLTDSAGEPVAGNFSVSVTSDREITPDSASNILTCLLLASDLRGTIENPAYYFQNTPSSAWALDLLMRTQGWRRYNISEIAKGRFSKPAYPIELGHEISGTVQSLLLNKPVADIEVTVMSLKSDYFETTQTDTDGRFHFYGGELADSTGLIVSAIPKRGITRLNLLVDGETFPEKTLLSPPPAELDRVQFAKYADKAERQYISEGGMRLLILPEVAVTAQRQRYRPPVKSPFYNVSPGFFRTAEDIEQMNAFRISDVVMNIPGFSYKFNAQGHIVAPLLLIDNMPAEMGEFWSFPVFLVEQIDVLKNPSDVAIFGSKAYGGVIAIHTKKGKDIIKDNPLFHIRTLLPLGYQPPDEFYAPKYDTPEKRDASVPDLRTTIHWQPVVQTDNQGIASFEFYTADEPASYTVSIEGLADDGKIIRQLEKINIER